MPYFNERRSTDRTQMFRPLKMYDPRARKYRPGCTHNLSAGGALIEIKGGEYLSAGDEIEICVDWLESDGVKRKSEMMPVNVLRTGFTDDGIPLLAIRFAQGMNVPQAA